MKMIPANLKYINYLFWLGPMLVLAGVSAGIVSGNWGAVPVGLVIAGIVIIGLWLLYLSWSEPADGRSGFWTRRSTQASANALVATIAVLVILGLINFLGAKYTGRLDLTENQLFTLSPQSKEIVHSLKQPIKVLVFDPQQNPQDRELLEDYRRQSNQFSFEFVNPDAQPTLAQQYEVKNLGDVFVTVPPGNRKQLVQTVNAQERLSETKLTNAIEQVLSDRQAHVYVLTGHGERPIAQGKGAITQAVQGLKDKNLVVASLNLLEANFPTDADVVVLAGPQKPLLEPEVKALDTYLKGGGNLLLLVDPNANPGLDAVLSSWGVTFDPRAVIDVSGRVAELGPAYATVTQYGDHPITKDFGNTLSIYPLARPVDVKSVPNVKSTPLLYTSDRSWAESNLKEQPLKFDPQTDRQGPLVLGFALSRPVTATPSPAPSPSPSPSAKASPGAKASPSPSPAPTAAASPSPSPSPTASPTADQKKESRLVAIGNSSFAADGVFNQGVNGDLVINSVRWLSQQDQELLSIRPKEAKNRRIVLSSQQANLVAWTALGILPLIGFGTALAVWWRRR